MSAYGCFLGRAAGSIFEMEVVGILCNSQFFSGRKAGKFCFDRVRLWREG